MGTYFKKTVYIFSHYNEQGYWIAFVSFAVNLILYDIVSADNNYDLSLILKLKEHLNLTVGLESWQNSGGMVVIKELTSKLKVQLTAEISDSLTDFLGL